MNVTQLVTKLNDLLDSTDIVEVAGANPVAAQLVMLRVRQEAAYNVGIYKVETLTPLLLELLSLKPLLSDPVSAFRLYRSTFEGYRVVGITDYDALQDQPMIADEILRAILGEGDRKLVIFHQGKSRHTFPACYIHACLDINN